MSSYNTTPNFDNLLLQSLMSRLQIDPPNNHLRTSPLPSSLPQTLEDLLLDVADFSDADADADDNDDTKSDLAKEESKLEKEIVRTITSGNTDCLKPNSGQAVAIGEHHICVGFHEEKGSGYRVWEWHGHIMLFDEEDGYKPEYIYGNYFERLNLRHAAENNNNDDDDDDDGEVKERDNGMGANLGLRELIESKDSDRGRVLHRNVAKVPLN